MYPSTLIPPLSSVQAQTDGLVESFVQQATDWRSLAALMAGGLTYRFGSVEVMGWGVGAPLGAPLVGWAQQAAPLRVLSVAAGLGAEVTAFEMTNRSLSSLTGETRSNPNLWRWEGQGGLRQGLLSSLVTFATLKGSARVAQGENIVVQHLLQDTGMVLGHQVTASFGITDRPQGTFVEQFLHAEATNLQMSAGMALAHSVAPGIQGLERGLDLSLRSIPSTLSHSPHFGPAFAVAGLGKTDLEQFGGPKIILNSFDDTGDPRFPGNAGGGSGRADEISGAFQRVEQRYKIPFLQYLRRNIHS